MLLYQIFAYTVHGKINLKYQVPHGIKNLNQLMDHILPQVFKIVSSILSMQNQCQYTKSIKIRVNKIENRITFQIKKEYYLQRLASKTMKLLGITKNKISKDENGENVPRLEIIGVVLVHRNIVNNDYREDSRVLFTFVLKKLFGQLLDISRKYFMFLKTFSSEFSYIEALLTDQNYKPLEKVK